MVLIDVDGTLIGNHDVHPRVWSALATARREGIRVGLCTGRPGIGSTLDLAARVGPDEPHILLSGAVIGSPGRPPMLTTALAPPVVRALRDLAAAHDVPLELYIGEAMVVERLDQITVLHAENLGVTPTVVASLADLTDQPVAACFTVPHDQWPSLETACAGLPLASVSAATTPWAPDTTFVNVGAAGTSKGAAISWLLEHLDLTRDTVAMVGDGMNDLDAFDAVGLAIAVGGAPLEVRAAADLVVGDADQGAVADALEHVLELKRGGGRTE
ncbi:HAD family hydrolase [Kribbella sp. NPDC003505]|uniref:HAD family hydrolase n=1 Tax=Kribbella sp. NPDC003505 TaxID=3154448 RepID=UPI0033BDA0D1